MNITYTTTRTVIQHEDGFADIMAQELVDILTTDVDADTKGALFTDLFIKYTGCNTDVAVQAHKELAFQQRCEPHEVFLGIVEGVLIGMALANGNVKGTA